MRPNLGTYDDGVAGAVCRSCLREAGELDGARRLPKSRREPCWMCEEEIAATMEAMAKKKKPKRPKPRPCPKPDS